MIKLRKDISRKIKWGVAGLGRYSEYAFIPTSLLVRRMKINSIFSNDENRAKVLAKRYSIPFNFNNYKEFLASDINAVYIGSKNSDHYYQVKEALLAGKHVLCDKPFTINSEEAKELVDLAAGKNLFLSINFNYRFHPLINKAKAIIDSKLLGELISIKGEFNINIIPGSNFRYIKKFSGGGPSRDLASHIFDLFRYFNGDFSILCGIKKNIIYPSEVEDYAAALIEFHNGSQGFVETCFSSSKSFNRIVIMGTKGSISLENLIAVKFPQSAKMIIILEGEAKKVFRKRANMLHRLLRSVNRSIIKNQKPEITGEDGFVNMMLLEELDKKCILKN